jgi:hypothetical protein
LEIEFFNQINDRDPQDDAFKAVVVLAAAPNASGQVDQIASTLKELNPAFGDNF